MSLSLIRILSCIVLLFSQIKPGKAQCPWSKDLSDLHGDCICALNQAQRLSVQCSPVNFDRLLTALKTGGGAGGVPIDLLYVHNASINELSERAFEGLDIQSLHLAKCGLEKINVKAFEGLARLTSLNLQDNKLRSVPSEALKPLITLKQLDISNNLITQLENGAFDGLPLTTLKLADNKKLILEDDCFQGLESTLKNLNMKGVGIETIPKAIGRLSSVAFLDLAQNQIAHVGTPKGGGDNPLNGVSQLTALNLERNRIAKLEGSAFVGVNSSLSSLSLLNNLLVEFPSDVLDTLGEIRVLDLGFNGIRKIPITAFSKNTYLTLLALDGNPMETIPEEAFQHINSTLRGLSIGGSYLKCDCRIKWVSRWIRQADLQVTSRERNPQFCAHPEELRRKSFDQIQPEEFVCQEITTEPEEEEEKQVETTTTFSISEITVSSSTGSSDSTLPGSLASSSGLTPKGAKRLSDNPSRSQLPESFSTTNVPPSPARPATQLANSAAITVLPPSERSTQRITMIDAFRRDSSVTLQWDSLPDIRNTEAILGFRVLYRFFGEREFRRGPKLNPHLRNFTLDDLPGGQCLVVCVVEAQANEEEITSANGNASTAPVPSQCREVRTERNRSTDLDTIVIAASASVCGFIVLAVILFLCCFSRKRNKNRNVEKPRLPPTMPLHVSTIPAVKSEHEWESLSVYSGRSIPRARMYQQGPGTPTGGGPNANPSFIYQEDSRSHLSAHEPPLLLPAGSHVMGSPNGVSGSGPRSTADGQSHRSYSQLSTRFASEPHLTSDLSKSQQSLSHLSYNGPAARGAAGHKGHKSGPKKNGGGGRLASSSSLHSLTEYESDWTAANNNNNNNNAATTTTGRQSHNGNWKDHDVDIYVGHNHVAPNHSKYVR